MSDDARRLVEDERYEREQEIKRLERELRRERENRNELGDRVADVAAELEELRASTREYVAELELAAAGPNPEPPLSRLELEELFDARARELARQELEGITERVRELEAFRDQLAADVAELERLRAQLEELAPSLGRLLEQAARRGELEP